MPTEIGYKPTPSEWKEGEQYKKWTIKSEEDKLTQVLKDQEKPVGDPDITIKTTTPEQAVKTAEEGLKKEQIDLNLLKRQERLQKLISDYEINGKAEFFGSKNMEETYNKLKNELNEINKEIILKKELPENLKEKNANIKALESLLSREDIGPKDRESFQKLLEQEKAKFNKGKELYIDKEISPETRKKQEIIDKVAIIALNPRDNANFFKDNYELAFKKSEIENILNTEPDPNKRTQKLKEYLVGSLDQAISLRNEAKYGSGLMGKIKKFLNQGWGGALTKTVAGAGLIAGGLFTGMGIFSPVIYGAGLRMASEGITHLGQEINEKFNKNSRENLLKQGRDQLEQQVNAKIVELIKNPDLNSSEKFTQVILNFVDKTYAREIQTLVEQDSSHLEKAEKTRRYAGWIGGIGGLLGGMPMDIDADGASHFVRFIGNKWMQGDLARNLGQHLWSSGSLANFAGFAGGSMVTYMLNRGAEGDERAYKFNIQTTKSEQDMLTKAEKNIVNITKEATLEEITEANKKRAQEKQRKASQENLTKETTVGGKTKEQTVENAEKIATETAEVKKETEKISPERESIFKDLFKTEKGKNILKYSIEDITANTLDNPYISLSNVDSGERGTIAELILLANEKAELADMKQKELLYNKIDKIMAIKDKLSEAIAPIYKKLKEKYNDNYNKDNDIELLKKEITDKQQKSTEAKKAQQKILDKEIDKELTKEEKNEDEDEETFRNTEEVLSKKSTTE